MVGYRSVIRVLSCEMVAIIGDHGGEGRGDACSFSDCEIGSWMAATQNNGVNDKIGGLGLFSNTHQPTSLGSWRVMDGHVLVEFVRQLPIFWRREAY
ncbi:unnamed protein product [Lactuca saligna]|uniref:Uncharacterized protein n=1 Tax=Lactuca saligna TaxID=75948 RepID=A0AA36EK99_LACSI|nr:unnamed protein product [Lactuca saligna]